ncbi:MAG: hypothetical protein EKK37_05990 [Sphingobacteriales bacterium]|nr:MAG: hypothetical protein EKK37_05990 [Sphingobacteriales bacterium]
MKLRLFVPALLLTSIIVFAFRINEISKQKAADIKKQMLSKKQLALRCTPDWNEFTLTADEVNGFGPLPGFGKYTWKISTKNDSAQFYFNQGINMYYGFHIIEALASFKKAQEFDANCAMLYWAEALSYGPNINDLVYAQAPDALAAIQKAASLSENASSLEKKLINAEQQHYSADSTIKRSVLNANYTAAMKELFSSDGNNADVVALYVDAMMNEHPWDYWYHDGKPKEWTPLILSVVDKGLKLNTNHPGLNHYNIHMWEASSTPSKALTSADKLETITPGLSHMVHMPSHIYIRTGYFKKGTIVNEQAVSQYNNYKGLMPSVTNGAFLYEWHNLHMQAANALFVENYAYALKSAIACRNSLDTSALGLEAPVGDYIQYLWSTPMFTMIYYKQWDAILKEPKPNNHHHYSTAIWHYAQGIANAAKGNLSAAKASIEAIQNLLQEADMKVPNGVFNAPDAAGNVAINILQAMIADKENNQAEAIRLLKVAVQKEDDMVYDEPKDWLTPARSYLGYMHLKYGQFKEAATAFSESLKKDPGEPLAIKGLKLAIAKRKD